MSRFHLHVVSSVFLYLVASGLGRTCEAAGAGLVPQQPAGPVLTAREDSQALAAIRQKLADPVTLEFVETPLSDVVDFVKDYTGINIVIDKPALEEEGINSDTPVSIHVQSIKLASALNLLVGQYNLTWMLRDECLILTSRLTAGNHVVTRSYPVGDLVATPEDGGKLVALAQGVLASDRPKQPSERMQFLVSLKAIVLTDYLSAHERVGRLLEQLRGGREEPQSVKQIRTKLNDPVTLEFVETPLSDVIDFLKDLTSVNIVLDRPALEEEGINSGTPVSIHVKSIGLQSALKVLLNAYNLTFKIEDECLMITSKLPEQDRFDLRAYPVGKMLGDRAKLTGEEWLRLTYSVIPWVAAEADGEPSRRVFVPGTRVLARWADTYFSATVLELTETTYHVQFRVGEEDRDEWMDASRIKELPKKHSSPQPVIAFFGPNQSLVVFGPDSLQKEVETLIGLVVKTAERTAK